MRLVLFSLCLVHATHLPAQERPVGQSGVTLEKARSLYSSQLLPMAVRGRAPAPQPPAKAGLALVKYQSPAGELAAYLSPDPGDKRLHPLVIWLGGGFSNSISEVFWQPADPANDQSAAAFRQEKLLMMYPSFRGGNDNPGGFELFYGEVEDVLAAADHAAGLSYVDPQRIYLGGHSTGATLALLAAAMPKAKFRAVFAFGPVEDPQGYSLEKFPFDPRIQAEFALRAPAHYINTIRRRTYVIEGVEGNVTALRKLKEACKQPDITFVEVDGNHFSILAPLTKFLAGKVKADKSPAFSLEIAPLEWAEAIPR